MGSTGRKDDQDVRLAHDVIEGLVSRLLLAGAGMAWSPEEYLAELNAWIAAGPRRNRVLVRRVCRVVLRVVSCRESYQRALAV